jgi:hypothetical protein
MLKINIRTKPIERMRMRDVGDYYQVIVPPGAEEEPLKIIVARMDNPDYEFLVALHEFIESYLLKRRGVDLKEIDEWEAKFLKEKDERKRPKNAIAGEQKDCPYYQEHKIATEIEKRMAKFLKVNWEKYDKYLDELEESICNKK